MLLMTAAITSYGSCRDIAVAKGVLIVNDNQHSAPTFIGANKGGSKERFARPPVEY